MTLKRLLWLVSDRCALVLVGLALTALHESMGRKDRARDCWDVVQEAVCWWDVEE
jgi:hypothetical protein